MTISGGSSPTGPAAGSQRKRFALTGRSVRLDPRDHAVRGDLADVELAAEVFAPHYARATPYRCVTQATVLLAPDGDEVRATLGVGDRFHVLDLSAGWAWGHGDAPSTVGYVRADAITPG